MKVNDSTVSIISQLESPSTSEIISKETNIAWSNAEGIRVWDEQGIEYIDLTAGSGVLSVGQGNAEVVEAMTSQLKEVIHTGWQFPTRSRAELLQKMMNYLPYKNPRFLFTVTGSEAVEAALKVARLAKKRQGILSFQGGYHGKTNGSLQVTANPRFKTGVLFSPPEIFRIPYPEDEAIRINANDPSVNEYIDWIERTIGHPDFPIDQIAGMIVEPVQGASGMNAAPKWFLKRLRELCDKYDLLLIVDEIYTGLGRTGTFFGFEYDNVVPDIVILGKSLGGGLPISLVAAESSVMGDVPPYKQTSTFSGHPVACAGALKVLDIIERDRLPNNAMQRGKQLREALKKIAEVDLKGSHFSLAVTGRGLMLGVRLNSDILGDSQLFAKSVSDQLRRQNLLALLGGTHKNVIKVTPALTVTEHDVNIIVRRFRSAVQNALETRIFQR